MIQKPRFRNYRDSETAIQKLSRFRNYRDLETISRFRNYRDLETISRFRNYIAIQKLRSRTNRDSATNAIQKLRFTHYDSETIAILKRTRFRIYQDFTQGSDDITIPTPMELHIDLEWPQGSDDI